MATAKQDEFTAMLMALQGVTVLEAPRVSRETIIDTLREHTLILREQKKNMSSLTTLVTQLANEATENKRIIQNLVDDNKKIRGDVETLYRLSDEFRTEMNEMSEKLSELYALKAQMKEFRAFVDDFHHRYEKHVVEITEEQAQQNRFLSALDNKANETIFQLKELKEYVDHFGDNLILPSSQITVEASAGFDSRPKQLLEVLKMTNERMTDSADQLKEHSARLKAQKEEIDTKADEGVIHEVKGLQRKVAAIENHILKDEEQGVGAIRRTCEELVDKMQGITTEMNEKMDRREVSFVVHEKYEEIVKYLQDALQSSTEDEMNFKAKAEEIASLMQTLNNTKADRVEIAPMQEILVKTESMLKKLSTDRKGASGVTRKEVEALLELKVDKADLETTLSSLTKGAKRNKRLAALGGVSGTVIDEALPIEDSAARDQAMWKSLSDAMKDESDEVILRAAQRAGGGGGGGGVADSSDFSAYILSKRAQAASRGGMSPNPSGTPGAYRNPSEGGRPGPNQHGDGSAQRPASNNGYAAAFGQPGGPSYPTSLQASLASVPSPEAFGQHPEYPHVPPSRTQAQTQTQTQAQAQAQGQQYQQQQQHQQQQQQQQQQPGHDMSFLGAQVAGGGFNQRNTSALRSGPLAPLSTSPVEDVDGVGRMVRGADSKLYYTDEMPSPSSTSPTAAAAAAATSTAKKIDLVPRGGPRQ